MIPDSMAKMRSMVGAPGGPIDAIDLLLRPALPPGAAGAAGAGAAAADDDDNDVVDDVPTITAWRAADRRFRAPNKVSSYPTGCSFTPLEMSDTVQMWIC